MPGPTETRTRAPGYSTRGLARVSTRTTQPMSPARPAEQIEVQVDGRRLRLTSLRKVLYPETGFSKAEALHYYARIAPTLLAHLQGRAMTLKRYPDGVAGPH